MIKVSEWNKTKLYNDIFVNKAFCFPLDIFLFNMHFMLVRKLDETVKPHNLWVTHKARTKTEIISVPVITYLSRKILRKLIRFLSKYFSQILFWLSPVCQLLENTRFATWNVRIVGKAHLSVLLISHFHSRVIGFACMTSIKWQCYQKKEISIFEKEIFGINFMVERGTFWWYLSLELCLHCNYILLNALFLCVFSSH